MTMIYLGADHRGYELKEKLKDYLSELGYEYEDCGAFEYDLADDYPDFAIAVASKVARTEDGKGILICGSGIGVVIAANKIKGILAGTATSAAQITSAEGDEGLNVLALSADFVSEEENKKIVKTFLESKFSGLERHIRRVNKIKVLEEQWQK